MKTKTAQILGAGVLLIAVLPALVNCGGGSNGGGNGGGLGGGNSINSCTIKGGYVSGSGTAAVYMDCEPMPYCTMIDNDVGIVRGSWEDCNQHLGGYGIKNFRCTNEEIFLECTFTHNQVGGAISGMTCSATGNSHVVFGEKPAKSPDDPWPDLGPVPCP